MAKTYYLVMFDEKFPRMAVRAMKSIIPQEDADILFQDANATVIRKTGVNRGKFVIKEKSVFEIINADGSNTTFIVCDVKKESNE